MGTSHSTINDDVNLSNEDVEGAVHKPSTEPTVVTIWRWLYTSFGVAVKANSCVFPFTSTVVAKCIHNNILGIKGAAALDAPRIFIWVLKAFIIVSNSVLDVVNLLNLNFIVASLNLKLGSVDQ